MTRTQKLTLLATIIGSGVVFLDGSVVNLALPKIASNLHASFADLQWIVDGYTLSLAALLLLGGSLGDIFGRKRIYSIGLIGFGLSSLACGLAPSTNTLIIGRVVQGIFGALLVPSGLAIINTNFPAAERGRAIGTWSAWAGIFTVLGPLVGGYLLDVSTWRWIFFINLPLIIICFIVASIAIKETAASRTRRIDHSGALLAALSLAGLTYGLIEGPTNHWGASAIVPLIIGFLSVIGFLYHENRTNDPMVRLSLFRSRNFSGANLATFAMYGALSGFMFTLLIYLQTHLRYSSIKAGLSLIPVTLLMLFLSGRVGGLTTKFGPRLFMTVGPILSGLAVLSLFNLNPGASYIWRLLPSVLVFGVGLVLTVAPLTTTVMTSVSDNDSGIASGINNAVSRVAGLLVIAVLGLLGGGQNYHFSIVLCGSMAIIAGVLSWLIVQNPRQTSRSKSVAS